MPDSKPTGGRKKNKAEYHSGDSAAVNMIAGMRAVLSVDKKRIVELERRMAKKCEK